MPIRASKFRSGARLTRIAQRRGFTLVEILIVIVMISLISLVAIPRFSTGNGRRNMESARMRTAAALSTARQAAISKGETVQLVLSGNRVWVSTTADTTKLLSSIPLDTLYKVTAKIGTADSAMFTFNARGFANMSAKKTIYLTRPGVPNDSLVVLTTGMVQR